MSSPARLARAVLARHAGWPPARLSPHLHLGSDLGLTPLGMVLVAVEIEEMLGVDFPMEGLATVNTVGQVLAFFSRAVSRARRQRSLRRAA